MLNPVEIKVNIEGSVGQALQVLGEPQGEMSKRQIWFAEHAEGVAGGELRLLDNGVILRFRSGDGPDDVTVKLRPCTEQQLVSQWARPFETNSFEYRIEGDWSGRRRVLAASAVNSRPQGSLLDALEPGLTVAAQLSSDQQQFLGTCAPDAPVNRLVALGPIASTKFTGVALEDLEVNAERWTVADLDFLEVSIRVKPKDDETADEFVSRLERRQKKLETLVADRGVVISEHHENKTTRVLTALAAGRQKV